MIGAPSTELESEVKVELSGEEVKQAILDYVNARVQGEFNTVRAKYHYIGDVEVTNEEQEDAAQ